ncbi:MAG: pilus assembly protein [Alphaproteobacteria bacterium]|nr:pilus assembly protein [Alphaproteobacteria bacterium]
MKNRGILAWIADRRGVAASEFALLLPVMVLFLFGTVEVGNAILIQRKVTAAVQTAADLTAQATAVDDTDIANLFEAMNAVIEPYPEGDAAYIIESVIDDGGGNEVIDWVDAQGGGGGAPGDAVDLPTGLLLAGGSVIVAQVTYNYTPVFGDLVTGAFAISDIAYLRPRRTAQIVRQ